MKPIKPGLMPHLVTLYNVFKSPATGKLAYFRTFLKHVRLDNISSTVHVASIGWTRAVTSVLLVDPKTTLAYRRGTNNIKIKKKHLDSATWDALPDETKGLHWTLREGDYIARLESNGECLIDMSSAASIQPVNPGKINSIKHVLNKNGALHHWEVHLV